MDAKYGSFWSDILNTLLFLNKAPYELLHVKASKQILQILKCASNFGPLAELGRLPLMCNVICAICKYRVLLESMGNDDLLLSCPELTKTTFL